MVTGAASGIGLAAAQAFAASGMRVVLVDISPSVESAAAALRAGGAEALALVEDVSRPDSHERVLAAAAALGPVSLLMNNAGREGGGGLLAEPSQWESTLNVNLLAAVYAMRAYCPLFLKADYPCAVINTGSKQGITLPPGDTGATCRFRWAVRPLTAPCSV